MTNIDLPDADLSKTLGLIIDIYNPANPDEVLKTHLCNQLYTYRRKMIDDAKHIDKKRGKELEKWL